MNTIKLLVIFLFLFISAQAQNYKQVKIYLDNLSDVEELQNYGLEFDHPHYTKENAIEVWLSDSDFELLKNTKFSYEILIDEWRAYYEKLPKLTSEEKQNFINESRLKYGIEGFHFGSMGGFMTLAEAYAELDTLKNLFPNIITAKQSLGNTFENRPVYMVKISDNPGIDENEPEVLYTALHHAREPQSMMQLFYFMYYLLENYNTNPEVQYLVNNRELYFIPVVNPDGYEYNHITDPDGGGYWRKNRRANTGGSYGVDLNRNYGPYAYWNANNGGSSTTPSSDTYRGTAPFSEPETEIIRNFLATHKIKNALNYHTYSNLLIYPYGALSHETPDSLTFREYAADMTRFNGYQTGTDMQTVGYSTRGNSDDFFYDGDTVSNGGKIFAMTPEVGSSSDGFWPAQSRIFPLAQENLYPNLYYAWVAGEYITLNNPNFAQAYFNAGDEVQLYPSFKNKGLSTGYNVQIQLTSLSSYAVVNNGTINIDSIQSRNIAGAVNPLSFSISAATPVETIIKLLFTASSSGTEMSKDTVSLIIGYPEYLFVDTTNNPLSYWTVAASPATPFWESSTSAFYSSPACYTDSKSGNYVNNATVTLTLTNPIDLSLYSSPKLTFWTKFDIEDNWDYGQVEISSNNGSTWIPLSGNYTSPASGTFQPSGQQLYDGTQSAWVREEMSLSGYSSNQVKLRFKLRTDGSVLRDGWYIDDIGIIVFTVVPVELISFTGQAEGSIVSLNWETATEVNNYGFEIEKTLSVTSPDRVWNKIGFVSGAGNSNSFKNYSFHDENNVFGKYIYRLKQIDMDGSYKYSNQVEVEVHPSKFSLEQNYPNPFNPSTIINYTIPQRTNVKLSVYNILGSEIARLVNETKNAGAYEIQFDASKFPAGVYLYTIEAGNYKAMKKLVLIK